MASAPTIGGGTPSAFNKGGLFASLAASTSFFKPTDGSEATA